MTGPETYLAAPVRHGAREGLRFPACRVCGCQHDAEASWKPGDAADLVLDTTRVNEACDRCWIWYTGFLRD